MTVIYVDADACPVKDEIITIAIRHGCRAVMVSVAAFARIRTRWLISPLWMTVLTLPTYGSRNRPIMMISW